MHISGRGEINSVLLLGASGFFGAALTEGLAPASVLRTYATHPIEGGVRFDVRRDSVRELIARLPRSPDAVVILLGATNIDACARDPAGTSEINVRGIVRTIAELRGSGVMPVFLSSDGVFDGTRAFWTEADEPSPILTYGRQKVEVERYIAALEPPWLVVRLPKLLSPLPDPRCMLTQWIDALGSGSRIVCAVDQYFTPAATNDAAMALATLIRSRAHGLVHVGGPERVSRRQLLHAVSEEYAKFADHRAVIEECSLRDIPFVEARPLDTSLSSKLASRYGISLSPATVVARLAVRQHFAGSRGR